MLMEILRSAQLFARRFGVDVIPYKPGSHPIARRRRLIEHHRIDTVLDVGANIGQFGLELRRQFGYRGRIVSFEPLSAAYAKLQRAALGDVDWQVFQMALGDAQGTQTIHVAGNSESSSILEMLQLHEEAAPHSRYTGEETIRVETLDAMFDKTCDNARNIYLKVDTQGYEAQVLRGAVRSLERIDTIQVEMSLAPLYAGQVLFDDLYADLRCKGYMLVGVENNFGNAETGQLLQIDGIFRRESAVQS
ncbi:FkbM family methyltransferase [Variovorax sp. LG9.2]|uniref:FkbM family methyltransferase n=1 Tax=Variovorax sp. LG9.2 TaxID=3048626 RepID=UPI002B239842|nr:FkbM family methyltransferase [Variovorax sp. LG9.2]MEB0059036.1 FkbM family methyltransferase [Variovorax sp. LG9.2]